MDFGGITFTFAAIFLGAAVFASIALYTRQPIIIAYIILGAALGPFGTGLVSNTALVSDAGHVGIIFLLFLLGLDMQPKALLNSMKSSSWVALASSGIYIAAGYAITRAFGFEHSDALLVGTALMFSSTIIGKSYCPPPFYTTNTWAKFSLHYCFFRISSPSSCWCGCKAVTREALWSGLSPDQ